MRECLRPRVMPALLVAVAVAFSAGTAYAGEDRAADARGEEKGSRSATASAEQKPSHRERIVVTATIPDLPAVTEVGRAELWGKEIERGLAHALRDQPGLDAFQRGPINLDPTVRGLREGQIATIVDGTRTFAAGPARMDSELSHVDPHTIDRVTIAKGPFALAWGAGALAAVRVERHRPEFASGEAKWGGRAGFSAGNDGRGIDATVAVDWSSRNQRASLAFDQRQGDDYHDGAGRLVQGDYRSQNASWQYGFRAGEHWTIDYLGSYQEQHDIDYPGRLLNAVYFFTRLNSIDVVRRFDGDLWRRASIRIYASRKDHLMTNDGKPTAEPDPGRMPPFPLAVSLPTSSDTTGFSFRLDAARGSWSAGFGADGYRLEQSARRQIRRRDTGMQMFDDPVWPDVQIDHAGLYATVTRSAQRWSLTGTIRGDHERVSTGELSSFFTEHVSTLRAPSRSALSAALGAAYRLGPGLRLEAGIGRAVRMPSALERFSDRFPSTAFQIAAEFVGDPGLAPEIAHEADLGLSGTTRRFGFRVDVFWRRIEDMITVAIDPSLSPRLPSSPPQVYRYVNGRGGRFWGGELELETELSDTLRLQASASVVRGRDLTFDEPAFGVPPATGSVQLHWQPSGESLWFEMGIRGALRQRRVATARLELPTPGYSVVALRAGGRVAGAWRWQADIDNLFDRVYATHLTALDPFSKQRVPAPGRTLRISLARTF
ncbi:MAG: TonB-dependent receptor [Acidobacteria bacterium]|nr:MAG: TonB-dependent receptor [Acidobacteriota bacterium]